MLRVAVLWALLAQAVIARPLSDIRHASIRLAASGLGKPAGVSSHHRARRYIVPAAIERRVPAASLTGPNAEAARPLLPEDPPESHTPGRVSYYNGDSALILDHGSDDVSRLDGPVPDSEFAWLPAEPDDVKTPVHAKDLISGLLAGRHVPEESLQSKESDKEDLSDEITLPALAKLLKLLEGKISL